MNFLDYIYLKLILAAKKAVVYDKLIFPITSITLLIYFNIATVMLMSYLLGFYPDIFRSNVFQLSIMSFIVVLLIFRYGSLKKRASLEDSYAQLTEVKKKILNRFFWIYLIGSLAVLFLVLGILVNVNNARNKKSTSELHSTASVYSS